MMHSPSIPSWNALHPLVIHFPIALLLIAPLFVVVGAVISPPKGRTFLVSALILMVLGTASVFLAVETGKAAGQVAGSTPAIKATLEQHQDMAETTRVFFSLLTVAFAALLFVPGSLELDRRVNAALLTAFLIFYATGALFLVNTARHGGRLVHEFGVRAPAAASVVSTTAALAAGLTDSLLCCARAPQSRFIFAVITHRKEQTNVKAVDIRDAGQRHCVPGCGASL